MKCIHGHILLLALATLLLFGGFFSSLGQAQTKIIAENQTFEVFSQPPIKLLGSSDDLNSGLLKIVRNCIFQNAAESAIRIQSARNILIEDSTFRNLRTHIAGKGLIAINVAPQSGQIVDGVTFRRCKFIDIGADGLQFGNQGPSPIRNIVIDNCDFYVTGHIGENGIDIKAMEGPFTLRNSRLHHFVPCNPGDDCTGSNGPAMTIHSVTGPIRNVLIENNEFYGSVYGVGASASSLNLPPENLIIRGNKFHDHGKWGVWLNKVKSVQVYDNVFANNPAGHIYVDGSPTAGGSCMLGPNSYSGTGQPIVSQTSQCSQMTPSPPVLQPPVIANGGGRPPVPPRPLPQPSPVAHIDAKTLFLVGGTLLLFGALVKD